MAAKKVISMLNELRSAELAAIQQYMRLHYTVTGPHAREYADFFKQIAIDEMKHAEMAAERVTMLGGDPTEVPCKKIAKPKTAKSMLKLVLGEEEEAVKMYKAYLKKLPPDDPTTRRLIEDILADEERHADEARTLLE